MMIRICLLIISTILTVLFAVFAIMGKKYESYIESLDDEEYPLKELYVAGFVLSNIKLFSLKRKLKEDLVSHAKLLYVPRFAEFYANLAWAQALTFVHLFLCISFWFAAMMDSGSLFIFVIGLAFSFYVGYYWLSKIKNDLVKRQAACEDELPEIVSSLALLINSGMTLSDAWSTVAYSKESTAGKLMQEACIEMKNGVSAQEAIYRFGVVTNSSEMKKFTSSLAQGMQKGSDEISQFLMAQASEQWAFKKQRMLQKGEVAASKMLIPIVLIFVGVLVIIISTALGGAFL